MTLTFTIFTILWYCGIDDTEIEELFSHFHITSTKEENYRIKVWYIGYLLQNPESGIIMENKISGLLFE